MYLADAASINRGEENCRWANDIRRVGNRSDIDAVVVFVGNYHVDESHGTYIGRSVIYEGLEELLANNMGPFTKMYVANNIPEAITPRTRAAIDRSAEERDESRVEEREEQEISANDDDDDYDSKEKSGHEGLVIARCVEKILHSVPYENHDEHRGPTY